jgi:hypothetical protein
MPEIIFGILVLALFLWAGSAFATVDPRKLAPVLKSGGFGALGGAAFLAARGQFQLAIPLGFAGLGLLGWLPLSFAGFGFGSRTHKSPGQTSRVRSAFVEMELDHDTGAMRGRILAGRHEGVTLDVLNVATVVGFLPEIDEESRALLIAYLDRREPRWRENAEGDTAARDRQSDGRGGLSDPWRAAGCERRGDRASASRAHEETPSRPRGVDVSRGPRQ